ncbi:MAG: hypothetical protein ACK574_02115, partial [Bacteroidota bacterium]
MNNVYNPSFNSKKARPNRIVSIIEFIQPELKQIQAELDNSNYKRAIQQYEKLKSQYSHIIIDLIGIAYAYIHQGEFGKAEDFLAELITGCETYELHNKLHIKQARLIVDEIQNRRDSYYKIMDKLMYR